MLVAGGVKGNGILLASAELYQPTTEALQLTSAASRETHGTAGSFDLHLPITGDPGVEGRYGPSRPDIVFTFNRNVTGADSVTTSCRQADAASVDPNDAHSLLVKLDVLSCDQKFFTVSLSRVHDDQGNILASAAVTFGLLFGDVNGDGIVNHADITSIRTAQGQHINSSNFRNDLTLDGRKQQGRGRIGGHCATLAKAQGAGVHPQQSG